MSKYLPRLPECLGMISSPRYGYRPAPEVKYHITYFKCLNSSHVFKPVCNICNISFNLWKLKAIRTTCRIALRILQFHALGMSYIAPEHTNAKMHDIQYCTLTLSSLTYYFSKEFEQLNVICNLYALLTYENAFPISLHTFCSLRVAAMIPNFRLTETQRTADELHATKFSIKFDTTSGITLMPLLVNYVMILCVITLHIKFGSL
jgi:hypothetical protein